MSAERGRPAPGFLSLAGFLRLVGTGRRLRPAHRRYLVLTFWPMRLTAFYPHPEGAVDLGGLLLAAGLLLGISGTAVFLARKTPWLFIGWCWFLGTLVPMIGVVQVGNQAAADRYTYLPQKP